MTKIGIHSGVGGNGLDGISELWQSYIDKGLPLPHKAADGYVFESDLLRNYHNSEYVFRLSTAGNEGVALDVPDYNNNYAVEAIAHWQRIQSKLPPEFDKDKVWLECTNEVDKEQCSWLGLFSIELAKIAKAEGYKTLHFGWSSGEPNRDGWETSGILDFLRYCEQNPDTCGVSLHEYNYGMDSFEDNYPYHIGRFQLLFAVCDKYGIARPNTYITEWGYQYRDVPTWDDGFDYFDKATRLYNRFNEIKMAGLWYAGGGENWNNIADKVKRYYAPMADYVRNTELPEYPQPQPIDPIFIEDDNDMTPPSRIKHTIHLLPQDTTYDELNQVTSDLHPTRSAFTYSADVAHAVVYAGNDSSKVIVWNPERWNGIEQWLIDRGITFEVRYFNDQSNSIVGNLWKSPIGTELERSEGEYLSGDWIDVNGYANYYQNSSTGNYSYHTGHDLNLNIPYWDADAGKPVYPCASGVVTFAGWLNVWGNVVCVKYDTINEVQLWGRFGHLSDLQVTEGDIVTNETVLGYVGRDALGGPNHLHHDIAKTDILEQNPAHWPSQNLNAVYQHYISAYDTFNDDWWDNPNMGEYRYTGQPVSYTPMIHSAGSDWKWQDAEYRNMLDFLDIPVKFMSNGSNQDYFGQYNRYSFHLVRLFYQINEYKSPARAWEELRDQFAQMYNRGARHFEVLNELNLPQEGWGILFNTKEAYTNWLELFCSMIKSEYPDAKLWYGGLSPSTHYNNPDEIMSYSWPILKHLFYGFCIHAYTGDNSNVDNAKNEVIDRVNHIRSMLNLQKPLVISECSVNRGTDYHQKAMVYRAIDNELRQMDGIQSCVWYISWWDAPPEQSEHGENWLGTELPEKYKNG